LKDDKKYGSKTEMKRKLLRCGAHPHKALEECAANVLLKESGGDKWYPIGSADFGSAARHGETMFGEKLTYPTVYEQDYFESDMLKVAACLVDQGETTYAELLDAMGC